MKTKIILLALISFISTVSSIFWSKTSGNAYGTPVTNVRPDYNVPYNNYGYGYGYQGSGYQSGYQTVNSRPFYVFGNTGSSSFYTYPHNSGYFGFSNPLYGQNPISSNPFRYSSGYNNYNSQNPYYSKPYSFFPSGTAYSSYSS